MKDPGTPYRLDIYTYVPLVESDEYIKKPTPTIKLIHSQKVFEIYIQYPKVKILVQWHEKIKKCILLSKYKTGKNDLKSDHFGALEVNPKQTKKNEKHLFIKHYQNPVRTVEL